MPRRQRDCTLLALDIATETGWCVGKPSAEPTFGFYRTRDGGLPNKLIDFGNWLRQVIAQHQPELVAFEEPPNPTWGAGRGKKGTNATTILMLNALCTKAEEICAEQRLTCRSVSAGKWKKNMVGTSRFGKSVRPYPATESCAQRGWLVTNHNTADAVGVWLYAVAVINPDAAAKFDPLARRVALRRGQHADTDQGRKERDRAHAQLQKNAD